ncbi:MAG: hypothetical protein K2X68_04450, partial [Novosphingobium sp.]|nr:hypothetical protein [Novosphingobium sp.]
AQGTDEGAGIRAQGGASDGPGGLFSAAFGSNGHGVDAGASGTGSAVRGENVSTGLGGEFLSTGGHALKATAPDDKRAVWGASSGASGVGGYFTCANAGTAVHALATGSGGTALIAEKTQTGSTPAISASTVAAHPVMELRSLSVGGRGVHINFDSANVGTTQEGDLYYDGTNLRFHDGTGLKTITMA